LELANGKKNKFFTLETEGENRYYIEDFNAEETKGLNNVYLLAKEVPENSIVLDVGCAQGNFGKILKQKNCTIYGIDLDEKAIQYAEKSGNYNNVFLLDVTDKTSATYKQFENTVKEVDVVIISDVFEHIVNPTKILLEFASLLKENGIFLISVPNVSHIDILLNLMNDKFNYQDMGILDNTHLKFFTKTSFIDWIEQINETFDDIKFDCEYLEATFYNNDFLNVIKNNYYELFKILENSINYNGLQILFKLTKLPKSSIPQQLKRLQDEPKTDVVEILGNALKGKVNNVQNHNIVEGERLWYEQQLKWHKENLKNAEELIGQKDKYIKELEESVNWHIEKIHELNMAVEWYRENEKNVQTIIGEKDNYIKELEDSVNWHVEKVGELNRAVEWYRENEINMKELIEEKENKFKQEIFELRKKIFNMENSRSWRWTKFLRKNK